MALANLDAVLLEARGAFELLPEHLLAQLEEVQRMQSPRASASPQSDGGAMASQDIPSNVCLFSNITTICYIYLTKCERMVIHYITSAEGSVTPVLHSSGIPS